jgi:hypothetical protein
MSFQTIRDCDEELRRLDRLEDKAYRDRSSARLRYIGHQRGRVLKRRIELQHGDLFQKLGQDLCL